MRDNKINNKIKKYVCIDIGGTSIKYSIADKDGNIFEQYEMPTEAKQKGGTGILEKIKNIISGFLLEYVDNIDGICISTAGMVDSKTGKIIYALEKFIPDYTGMNLKDEIEKSFNINCKVENDVNCAGLGEMWLGAGKGTSSAVCLTIGTGIGGCVILDNKLLHGFSNSAGEVGYMNINIDNNNNNFQDLASTTALVRNVAQAKNIDITELNGKIIFELIKKGDEVCLTELKKFVKILAIGICNICYVVNPQVVILGGGIMSQENIIKPILDEELNKIFNPTIYKNTKICFAKMENNAGMLGALYNFLNN